MKLLRNAFIFYFLLFNACKSTETASSVTIPNSFLEESSVEIFNIENEIYKELTSENSILDLKIQNGVNLEIINNGIHSYVHLTPGEQLVLDTVVGRPNMLKAIGKISPENAILQEFESTLESLRAEMDFESIAKKEPHEFTSDLINVYAPIQNIVERMESDKNLNPKFKKSIKNRLLTTKGSNLVVYKDYYKYFNKQEVKLPDNFYDELESLDFMDPAILDFEACRSLATSWHAKDLNYGDFDSAVDYFDAVSKSAEESYGLSLTQEYCKFNAISDQINFGDGIDSAFDLVESFNASVTNPVLLNNMKKATEPWKDLRNGMDAPNFNAVSREGKDVKLSDLKGKTVYVDVWATWCGPCIAEIPALKKLEKDMHGKNVEFVSVSIDNEKDKQKWLDFVKEKDLKGVQLMAKDAWKSDIVIDYNIKGIPRFLVIDEGGKIKTANAPRPSEKRIKEVLLN